MTTVAPSPGAATDPDQRAARLTRWSLLMLPTFLVVFTALDWIGSRLVLERLGLHEGDLFLMERGVAGWATEVLFALVVAAAPVVGIGLAVSALRSARRWSAWVALVLNALLVGFVIYMFIDAVHMTYYPQAGWLWF